MEKKYVIAGFITFLLFALAFIFINPFNASIKSYDNRVNISELIPEKEESTLSKEYIEKNNITVIRTSSMWDPIVLDLDNEMNEAELIVIGTVSEIKDSKMTKVKIVDSSNDTQTFIYTDIVIDVAEYIKNKDGKNQKEITVRKDGGCVDSICYESEDSPNFKLGEKVFLLLTSRDVYTSEIDKGHFVVLDGIHGKFTISKGYGVRERVAENYRVYRIDDLTKLASGSK